MAKATLTKRLEFCSSHRYHNPRWDEAKNREVFGACNNVNTHGHNYLLDVTLEGEIDPVTGMIINLYDLKIILNQILEEFDHKNLNLDTPYFTTRIPTTENLALTLWGILQKHPDLPRLDTIRLFEDESLYALVTREDGIDLPASVVIGRRYTFSAIHETAQAQYGGHTYDLWVLLKGPVPEETGQIVNLLRLDHVVHQHLLSRWDRQNLSRDPAFSAYPVTDSSVAETAWNILLPQLSSPPLFQISVSQQEGAVASTCLR